MRAVVTGAAGFIGSHLCDRLLAAGHEVAGADVRGDFSAQVVGNHNLETAREYRHFQLRELDLATDDLNGLVDGADAVFHLAGRSGLQVHTEADFAAHVRDNVMATQRLLAAVGERRDVRFVFAGSSSVYGDAERLPTKESATPQPLSAYGVTKLAAENLVHLYARNFGMRVTTLRYFTVYGPRQRPDMAISRFMRAIAAGDEIEVFGDGEQTRDFTYVSDAVEATIRAAAGDTDGRVLNVGGGSRATVNQVLAMLEDLAAVTIRRRHVLPAAADRRHAGASINLARQCLGWEPRIDLRTGLAEQWSWFRRAIAEFGALELAV